MAYSTGSASSLDNLFSALETFITTHGWTIDRNYNDGTTPKNPAYHKNSCYVSFRYDNSNIQAQGISVGMYQALGYSAAQKSGNHTDDSGAGYYISSTPVNDASIDGQRCIYALGDGPYNYWFFERDDGGSGIYYVHVVVECRPLEYRHFGFGLLDKFGDWGAGASGGEYVYGHRCEQGLAGADSSYLLDGGITNTAAEGMQSAASIHMEGFAGQEASKWGVIMGYGGSKIATTDRGGALKTGIQGAVRGGAFSRAQGWFPGYPGFTGVIPLMALPLLAMDWTNKRLRLMGTMPDVRTGDIRAFEDQEEVTIGSDTWVFFPIQKRGTSGGATPQSDTYYLGVAYKKVTT